MTGGVPPVRFSHGDDHFIGANVSYVVVAASRYTLPPWQVLDGVPGGSCHPGARRAIGPYGCLSHLACTGSGTPPVVCSIWGVPSACAVASSPTGVTWVTGLTCHRW